MSSEPFGKGDFVRLIPSISGDEIRVRTVFGAAAIAAGITHEQFGYVTKVVWILGEEFYRVLWISPNCPPIRCTMSNEEIEKVSSEEVPEEYMRALVLESL